MKKKDKIITSCQTVDFVALYEELEVPKIISYVCLISYGTQNAQTFTVPFR